MENFTEEINIFRSQNRERFTVIDNEMLQDSRMSFGSKGLLAYVLSLPDCWKFSLAGLCRQSPDKRRAVETLIEELISLGYSEKKEFFNKKAERGRFSDDNYRFSEKVAFLAKFTDGGFPQRSVRSGASAAENQQLINTNIQNTNKQNNKIEKEFNKLNSTASQSEPVSEQVKKLFTDEILSVKNKEEALSAKKQNNSAPNSCGISVAPPEPLVPTKLGCDQQSLQLVHDLYTLFGKSTARLPKSPEDRSHKTFDSIIDIFNSLRAGTFASDYNIDKTWLSENKVLEAARSPSFSSWVSFHSETIKSAQRYLKIQKTNIADVHSFFFCTHGLKGVKVPAYSLYLKHLFAEPITDFQTQISKIKNNLEEIVIKTSEKFYNTMTAKFCQTFSEQENLRFWNGVSNISKWYNNTKEKLDYLNPDGNYKSYAGNFYLFLSTLYTWLDKENGAWGNLFPDIIQINGKQWSEFTGYLKKQHNIELSETKADLVSFLESSYRRDLEKRNRSRNTLIEDRVKELTSKDFSECEDRDITWDEIEVVVREKIKAEMLVSDMKWQEDWDKQIAKAREGRKGEYRRD